MTEQEARKKWCPKCGRGINEDGSWMFPCIASDCMRWPECLSWWIEHEKGDEPMKVTLVEAKDEV